MLPCTRHALLYDDLITHWLALISSSVRDWCGKIAQSACVVLESNSLSDTTQSASMKVWTCHYNAAINTIPQVIGALCASKDAMPGDLRARAAAGIACALERGCNEQIRSLGLQVMSGLL